MADAAALASAAAVGPWEVSIGQPIYLAVFAITCYGYHILCEKYFEPALVVLQDVTGLPDAAAGATLMAAGGCSPELFCNAISILVMKSNVGAGTVIGSELFNMLCIAGAATLLTGRTLSLQWSILQRDVFFYVLSIGLLMVPLTLGEVTVWSSLSLLVTYIAYVLVCMHWDQIYNTISCKHRGEHWLKWTRVGDILAEDVEAFEEDVSGREVHAVLADKDDAGTSRRAMQFKVEPEEGAMDEEEQPPQLNSRSSSIRRRSMGDIEGDRAEVDLLLRSTRMVGRHIPQTVLVTSKYDVESVRKMYEEALEKEVEDKVRAEIMRSRGSFDGPLSGDEEKEDGHHGSDDTAPSASMTTPLLLPTSSSPRRHDRNDEASIREKVMDEEESYEEALNDDVRTWPRPLLVKPLHLLSYPLLTIWHFTMPSRDALVKRYRYIIFMSLIWLGVLAYAMSYSLDRLALIWGMPSAIMGLTLGAAGTSLPNLFCSVIVARRGLGDMAVSNAFGSNVFNILIALGLPWFVQNCLEGGAATKISIKGIDDDVLLLALSLVVFLLLLAATRMHLHPWQGALFFAMYFAYVVYKILLVLHLAPAILPSI